MESMNKFFNDPKRYKEYYKDKCCGGNGEGEGETGDGENMPIFPETVFYGNAYVPFQQWSGNLYGENEALCSGTIFPELDQPYAKGGRKK